MTQSKSLPDHALRICSYAELQKYARAFGDGHLNLLILCGPPGVGKSRCLRQTAVRDVCWIDGNASAFGIYQQAYERRNQPIVLDDVDGLYRDRGGMRLLKTLCQTEEVKAVNWQTDAAGLERRGIPRQFTTTSRVAIVANQWHSFNADVAALEDRGHFLVFEPTAEEVHRQAATWYWDQEILDFVGRSLHLMKQPSFRTYLMGSELKKAELDWQSDILARCLTGPALMVARLREDSAYGTEEARARAFVESGAGCRASYFNHARKLKSEKIPPGIKLVTTTPPAENHAPALASTLHSEQRGLTKKTAPFLGAA